MSVLENFRWPSLARDLAVMQTPGSPLTDFSEIYDTYRITEDELKKVIQIPEFQQMYRNELEGFRAQGSRAASLYRAGTLSQALTEHLFSDAVAGKMKAPDMLKLLELLLKFFDPGVESVDLLALRDHYLKDLLFLQFSEIFVYFSLNFRH